MGKCFVIQPFDGARFDKRYGDVYAPAIEDAGLDPYRVDRDPSVAVPIDEIARQIVDAEVCLCDITTDNPNVWFELGYAIASNRDVVMICADERKTPFPFDVQHRTISKYSTESVRDFAELRSQITARLVAVVEKRATLGRVGSLTPVARFEGLEQIEIAALVAVAQGMDHPQDGASVYQVRRDLEAAGFTKLAATLGLRSLLDKELVVVSEMYDEEVHGEPFTGYQPTKEGLKWLFANKDKLALRAPATRNRNDDDDAAPF